MISFIVVRASREGFYAARNRAHAAVCVTTELMQRVRSA